MPAETTMIGQLLMKANLITEVQLNYALRIQKIQGKRLGSVLLKLGYINEDTLITFLSRQYNAPQINISKHVVDPALIKLVPYETARRLQVIPISKDGLTIKVAMSDPSNSAAIDEVQFLTGMKASVYVAAQGPIIDTIEKCYSKKEKTRLPTVGRKPGFEKDLQEQDNINKMIGEALDEIMVIETRDDETVRGIDAPIVKLANSILVNAIRSRASDIHIEPSEDSLRIRYRVDGVLQQVLKLPVKIKNALTSRIKILSHLDISERRLPQDGRMKLRFGEDKDVDFRVSTLPILNGEKVVLRILDRSSLQPDLSRLGFEDSPLKEFLESIEKPYGMILVTGPTGSGKTTTLYAALQRLNRPGVNIMTAEDPVEYSFHGINQAQIKEDIGLSFAAALRSFLRQDPDIIMVGEIRDFETAEIAVKAALTGHLVLSTLHTNDAPSSITRLINMGIEPFLVSSSVIMIVAQRLVRKICEHCKKEQQVPDSVLQKIGFTPDEINRTTHFKGTGCSECNNTGYRGRIAVYEAMSVRDEIRELILQGASALDIKRETMRLGMRTLRQAAIRKVVEGLTTIDEVLKVTFED